MNPLATSLLTAVVEGDGKPSILALHKVADVALDMVPERPFNYTTDTEKRYKAQMRTNAALKELMAALEDVEDSI